MVIDVDLRAAPAAVRLLAPDDFGAFKVVVRGGASRPEYVGDAIEPVGRVSSDGHVFVEVTALKGLAGDRAEQQGWLASLSRMVEFAAAHGWTDGAGAIRAHVEWRA